MKQYLELLQTIKERGTQKEQARDGMPTTQSLFGHQMRFDLRSGFPILTTKEVKLDQIAKELLWILRGQTNVINLIREKANFWTEDSYAYYCKVVPTCTVKNGNFTNQDSSLFSFEQYKSKLKSIIQATHYTPSLYSSVYGSYRLGDCGFQYGKTWRNFGGKDQVVSLLNSLSKQPFSRRHIISAVDPGNDTKLALYWCHAMVQFNVRPATRQNTTSGYWGSIESGEVKYILDCHMYQRSADVFLGVPYNISSYSLLTYILCKLLNMIPGEYIHTFGDVHIYSNHKEQVDLQLTRNPKTLPKLLIDSSNWETPNDFTGEDVDKLFNSISHRDFSLSNYEYHEKIKAELSTGIKK